MAFYLFDLDGTLALNDPRRHFVDPGVETDCYVCLEQSPIDRLRFGYDSCVKCGGTGKFMWKDWASFFELCHEDAVNHAVFGMMRQLARFGHVVEIWSGRTDAVKDKTLTWLETNGAKGSWLTRMRPEGDFRPDHELKLKWLTEHRESGRPDPLMVFDDRDSVVSMWREAGLCCAQVAEGSF